MTEIRVGQVYLAKEVKTGRNDRGPWEMIIVQAPGRSQTKVGISVLKPPSNIGPNGLFKVNSIRSVAHRKWRDKKGRWHEGDVTVRASVKSLAQLSDAEAERLQGKTNYNVGRPRFKSLGDFFND